ncbi:MAG TPA: hypothetical protein VGM37_20905 [Armatimonadota bacterium]|jgi:hypothetical protein
MRIAKRIAGCVVILFVLVVAALWCVEKALDSAFEWSHDEVSRVPSPSHKVDAVVVETNGGATTSFGYEVYLTAPGKPYTDGVEVANLYGAVRNSSAYGVNAKWRGPGRLAIEYLVATNAEISSARALVGGQAVLVTLKSGVYDPKARSGGMLYNLRGRPDD